MLDVSRVHRREPGMTAYEVMLSESQERMLLVVPPDGLPEVRRVFDRWDIPLAEIGQVTREAEAKIVDESPTTAGHLLLLAGADTGRDGIHGASGLASRSFEEEQELRPTAQVGNPFLEKILIEACLEALSTGGVPAIQDLGAAGLTSAVMESAARGGRGVLLDVSRVFSNHY